MTVFALPASAGIQRLHWELQRNDVMDGVQALRASDPIWRASLEFSPDLEANSGYLKALFMRLRGSVHQLELHDWARPAPVGTMRGVLSLASSVAAGATSMSIVAANDNLVLFPEENDNAYWSKSRLRAYGAGSTANAIIAPDGTLTGDKIVEDTQTGPHHTSRVVPMTAGVPITWSSFIQAGERTKVQLQIGNGVLFSTNASIRVNLLTGAVEFSSSSVIASSVTPAPAGWWRIALKAAPISTGSDAVFRFMADSSGTTSYTGDNASGLYVWGAKLETGDLTDYGYGKTLKKGDLLGIGSGTTQQVVMVTEDAVSTSQGNITVKFQPPLRNAFSAGQSVVWDKPKALFRRVSNELGWDYRGKNPVTSGMTLDLVEDTRP